MAVEIHRVSIQLVHVDSNGNAIDKNDPSVTLGFIAKNATQDFRVVPNVSGPVSTANSADSPDIDTYLQREADDGFALAYRDHYEIVTQMIT